MKSCCFKGHRDIEDKEKLLIKTTEVVQSLIEQGVKIFYFGSKSSFNSLCLNVVTDLKATYPDIKLVYARSMYSYVNEFYKNYLLEIYDDTFMPQGVENAGRASYVKRNQAIIDASDYCVFYYNQNYLPPKKERANGTLVYQRKSGTRIAYEYAKKKNKLLT